jgi:hypothetical protein
MGTLTAKQLRDFLNEYCACQSRPDPSGKPARSMNSFFLWLVDFKQGWEPNRLNFI